MDERKGFRLLIRRPNAADEELHAQVERVIIGSAAHCEVRLPIESAAPEHVELTVSGGRIFARARAFEPAPTIGGSPFVQGFVDPGGEIAIGPVRIAPSLTEGVSTRVAAEKGKSSSTMRLAVMGGAAAVLLFMSLGGGGDDAMQGPGAGVLPPPLWGPAPTTCPQNSPTQALALAEERRRMGEGKRERRPFHLQDGVAAIPLFELASVCYMTAGDGALATTTAQAAKDLRTKVNEDYHAHQVRLEHAISVKDGATVWHEVAALLAMTDGLSGPYVSWLTNLQRAMRAAPKEG